MVKNIDADLGVEGLKTVFRDAGQTTGSVEAWDMAEKWLRDCTHQHESCRRANDYGLPLDATCLLDLGTDDRDNHTIKLVQNARRMPNRRFNTFRQCSAG